MVLFCSIDALAAGIVYSYWQIGLKTACGYMGIVNLVVILAAVSLAQMVRG